ncbi:MAG: hypothetical protein JWN86_2860 [Planctomycetota bacterium]|nr:hypothetical protein [Planctomycetota bacterium]
MRWVFYFLLALTAIAGCSEGPRGHDDPSARTTEATEGKTTESGTTTKIPMH